jgi:hypothetical protein
MPVSIDELDEFRSHPTYARFVRTNLHMHTPATPWDWDNYANQSRKAATLTPEDYFKALNETSLQLVAITDHNCVCWCMPLIELAKKARREGRSKLYILPGVEITTYEGPHLLAIFDEKQDVEEIRTMLVRLGMSGEGRKDDRAGIQSPNDETTISRILEEVAKLGGIAIGAHVHQKDGLWGPKEFRGRNNILNDKRLRILAAPSGDIKRVVESPNRVRLLYKNMDTTLITNSFGFINVSDCHRLEDFELDTTWIRMTSPSLNGIRQIVHEPELRVAHRVEKTTGQVEYPETIHFAEPTEASHPHIIALSITGGMLNGQKVALSPNQNCIIGKNYAGKSALLDCLRFSLNAVPIDGDAHDRFADRMCAFVGQGGEVRVYLRDSQGTIYGISRTLSCTQLGRSGKFRRQIEGSPDVFRLWNNEFRRESDLSIEQILHLEVYPQGEVVRIKDNVSQQMRIVDALAKLEFDVQDLTTEDLNGERTLRGKLGDNSLRIVSQTARQNELSEGISGIAQLQLEIDSLEKLTISPLFTQKKQWSETEIRTDGLRKELLRLSASWSPPDLSPISELTDSRLAGADETVAIENPSAFGPDIASPDEYSDHALRIFLAATAAVKHAITSTRKSLDDAIDALTKLEIARKGREEKVDSELRLNLRADDQGSEEGGLIDRITEKRRRLNDLQQKQREHARIEADLGNLAKERTDLLEQFHARWGEIRKARRVVVQTIDSASASNIKAELTENTDRDQYRQLLNDIADRLTSETNRIQNKEAQLAAIAASTTPSQLLDLVKEGNASHLTDSASGVTPHTARIVLGMGQADTHKLEQCVLGDKFVIGYKKHGDTQFTPIDSGLSGGEQALALISVAMVPKQLPLAIDQPEDELGPALITHELVEQIRRVKSERQLIFVTHVPNIPILADSEQVVYIEQTFTSAGKASEIECCGSLDQLDIVKHLLELDGGDIAFRKRSERYSAVMRAG